MSSEPKLSLLKLRQTRRFWYLRKIRHFAEGFSSWDLGLWRRFEEPAIAAVARDFNVIGLSLRRQCPMRSGRQLMSDARRDR